MRDSNECEKQVFYARKSNWMSNSNWNHENINCMALGLPKHIINNVTFFYNR